MTALLVAAVAGRDDGIKTLLERGADVNACADVRLSNRATAHELPQDGCTAAHYAAKSKNGMGVMKLLMESGVDLETRNAVLHGWPF